MTTDSDVSTVLLKDGVGKVDITTFVNRSVVSLGEVQSKMDTDSWAARVTYNKDFGGVLICQHPGEGNRMHYHPDADECWVILTGILRWDIEGKESKTVHQGDIINVASGTKHRIECIGKGPGIRFAITKPDVKHVYSTEEENNER